MAVFFEGRQTHNSEYNIELGDGGDITPMVFYFIGWLFFLKNPVLQTYYIHMYIHTSSTAQGGGGSFRIGNL